MSEQEDKQLHAWVRQTLDEYRPNYDSTDWVHMQRILRRQRWKLRGLIWGGSLVVLSLLTWFIIEQKVAAPRRTSTRISIPVAPTRGSSHTTVLPVRQPITKPTETPSLLALSANPIAPKSRLLATSTGIATPEFASSIQQTKALPSSLTERIQGPKVVGFSAEEVAITQQMQTGNFGFDSTSYRALTRNVRSWPNAVIVCDLTTSMYPYTTQLFAWFKQQTHNPSVQGMVFFTDCDSLGQQTRPGGPAGQMFITRERNATNVLPIMLSAARNTVRNEDDAENDIEALLAAQNEFPKASHLILLADNMSTVKDMALLDQIRKPVHIVLCGTTGNDTTLAFQTDYFTIANRTHGSLHTLEDDLITNTLSATTTLRVGTRYYRYIPRKQRFKATYFNHRPKRILRFIWL